MQEIFLKFPKLKPYSSVFLINESGVMEYQVKGYFSSLYDLTSDKISLLKMYKGRPVGLPEIKEINKTVLITDKTAADMIFELKKKDLDIDYKTIKNITEEHSLGYIYMKVKFRKYESIIDYYDLKHENVNQAKIGEKSVAYYDYGSDNLTLYYQIKSLFTDRELDLAISESRIK